MEYNKNMRFVNVILPSDRWGYSLGVARSREFLSEYFQWCNENLGPENEDWDVVIAPWDASFGFKRLEDAMFFILSFSDTASLVTL